MRCLDKSELIFDSDLRALKPSAGEASPRACNCDVQITFTASFILLSQSPIEFSPVLLPVKACRDSFSQFQATLVFIAQAHIPTQQDHHQMKIWQCLFAQLS